MGKTALGLSIVLETQRNTLKVLLKDGDISDPIFKFYFLLYLLHVEVLLNIKKMIILSFDTEIIKPLLC